MNEIRLHVCRYGHKCVINTPTHRRLFCLANHKSMCMDRVNNSRHFIMHVCIVGSMKAICCDQIWAEGPWRRDGKGGIKNHFEIGLLAYINVNIESIVISDQPLPSNPIPSRSMLSAHSFGFCLHLSNANRIYTISAAMCVPVSPCVWSDINFFPISINFRRLFFILVRRRSSFHPYIRILAYLP